MPTPVKILRLFVPGMDLINRTMNTWYDMIERHDNMQGEWPVIVDRKSFGDLVKFDQRVLNPPRIMVVTTDIPAATGTTTLTIGQTGMARDAAYDRTAHTLAADTTQPIVMVLNYHNKKFVAGAFIAAFSRFGQLWAFDINDCAKFT